LFHKAIEWIMSEKGQVLVLVQFRVRFLHGFHGFLFVNENGWCFLWIVICRSVEGHESSLSSQSLQVKFVISSGRGRWQTKKRTRSSRVVISGVNFCEIGCKEAVVSMKLRQYIDKNEPIIVFSFYWRFSSPGDMMYRPHHYNITLLNHFRNR